MGRIVVVANQTLGSPELVAVLASRLAEGRHSYIVIVAPTSVSEGTHQWDYPISDHGIPDPGQIGHALAAARVENELERLRALGVTARGDVVDGDAIDHVRTLLMEAPVDEVIVCTLPERASHWLRIDLPQRMTRALEVPVTHLPGSEGPVPV